MLGSTGGPWRTQRGVHRRLAELLINMSELPDGDF